LTVPMLRILAALPETAFAATERVVWELVLLDGAVQIPLGRVLLSQVPEGRNVGWPRLEALDPVDLHTVATMWAPKTTWAPAGALIEGMPDLDGSQRVSWFVHAPEVP